METKKLTRKEKIAQGLPKPVKRDKVRKERREELRQNTCAVRLNDYPTSPRKMRYIADMIRGMQVDKALAVLKLTNKAAALPMRKLLLSGIASWEAKFGRADAETLVIKLVYVDGGRMLKRVQPAPQGRAYRVRKRSNHITMVLDSLIINN